MHIANNGRILLYGQEPHDLNSPSGFWIYNEKGEVLFDSGLKFREVGIGCFSNNGEKFVLAFNTPPPESDYTEKGISADKEFPGIVLLYNNYFALKNSYSFDYISPISVKFSTDDSRIYLSFRDCINWKECMNPESYVIKTITYDDNLNEISITQQTKGELRNE
jgi:hypothetical protein